MMPSDRTREASLPLEKLPPNVFLGESVLIYGAATFERFRSERQPGLLIGDGSVLEGVELVVEQGGRVEIGERCRLVGVTIICSKQVVIGDDVEVGAGATIQDSVQIGRGARIESGAMVTQDVPAGARVSGGTGRGMRE